ncbi:MAG: ABC transporter substrate-binding protein [Cyanobacteria bacterium P01_A01_bin.137]
MKRLRFAVLCLATAILFIACNVAEPESVPQSDDLPEPTTAVSESHHGSVATLLAGLPPAQTDLSGFPVTVENCNRTLIFPQPPQRAIGLWQPPNEMLLALGVQDQLIGLAGNYTELPPALAADSIPSLGTGMRWPSREVMLTQNPDLIVSEGLDGFAFDPAQGYATAAELTQAGAQVVSTGSSCNPGEALTRGIDVVYSDLQMLAKIFGVSERGDTLVEKLQQRQTEILQKVEGLPRVPTIFYNGGEGPLNVLTAGVWGDAIDQARGDSVFDDDIFQVGLEDFANSNAEVILMGTYPGQDADTLKSFLTRTFPNLPAVQNGRLYPIPTIETEASIRIMDGLEKIAQAIHPEAFE